MVENIYIASFEYVVFLNMYCIIKINFINRKFTPVSFFKNPTSLHSFGGDRALGKGGGRRVGSEANLASIHDQIRARDITSRGAA